MRFWQPDNLARITAGRWSPAQGPPPAEPLPVRGVSIDSRAVGPGQAFVAIAGERFDGHDFVDDAIQAGAALIVVSREIVIDPLNAPPVLVVDDTVAALQALARAWRDKLGNASVRVIAVAGSNGKTTTRHLIHTVLSGELTGTQSPRSFNNHLGVPLTLLNAQPGHDFVVCEIGTNHPGEIASLAAIVRPDDVVLTSISLEHAEGLGDLAGVAREEGALLDHIAEGGGLFIEDDAYRQIVSVREIPEIGELVRYSDKSVCEDRRPDCQPGGRDSRRAAVKSVRSARQAARREPRPPSCDLDTRTQRENGPASDALTPANEPVFDGERWRFTLSGGLSLALPMPGRHNVANALAAVGLARRLGVSDGAIGRGLANATAVAGRCEVRRLGAVTVIHDAYNANPASAAHALAVLADVVASRPGARGVAVLGDMLELGDAGPALHGELGARVAEHHGESVAIVVLIGKLSLFTAQAIAQAWPPQRIFAWPEWRDDLPEEIARLIEPGDVVLLKGSRGMALERLIPALERAAEPEMLNHR